MANSAEQTLDIEKDIAELSRSPIQTLRQRWRVLFKTAPPAAFGPDLLRRSIAHKIQEQRYGGLSAPVQRQLNHILKTVVDRPNGRIELPRRIRPGAVLVRTWKDKTYRVVVLEHGFEFEGRTFSSLSEVARKIAGSRWNGPKFFGLRTKAPASPPAALQASLFGDLPSRPCGASEIAPDTALTSELEVDHGS